MKTKKQSCIKLLMNNNGNVSKQHFILLSVITYARELGKNETKLELVVSASLAIKQDTPVKC